MPAGCEGKLVVWQTDRPTRPQDADRQVLIDNCHGPACSVPAAVAAQQRVRGGHRVQGSLELVGQVAVHLGR